VTSRCVNILFSLNAFIITEHLFLYNLKVAIVISLLLVFWVVLIRFQ